MVMLNDNVCYVSIYLYLLLKIDLPVLKKKRFNKKLYIKKNKKIKN